MKLTISHQITTTFEPARRRYVQSHKLHPTICASQKVLDWAVSVSNGALGASFTDGAGDMTSTVSTPGEVTEVTLTVKGTVATTNTHGVLKNLKEKVAPVSYLSETRLIRADGSVTAMAKEAISGIKADAPLDRAHAISNAVGASLETVDEEAEPLRNASDVFESEGGDVCDAAHLLIAAAHAIEMPARFVCGYIGDTVLQSQWQADEDSQMGASVIPRWHGHTWAEIWVEGLGWVGFDPLGECCPDDRYVRLCSGRDATDAAPLRGLALGDGVAAQQVALDVATAAQ